MRSLELAIKYLAGDRLQGTAAERAELTATTHLVNQETGTSNRTVFGINNETHFGIKCATDSALVGVSVSNISFYLGHQGTVVQNNPVYVRLWRGGSFTHTFGQVTPRQGSNSGTWNFAESNNTTPRVYSWKTFGTNGDFDAGNGSVTIQAGDRIVLSYDRVTTGNEGNNDYMNVIYHNSNVYDSTNTHYTLSNGPDDNPAESNFSDTTSRDIKFRINSADTVLNLPNGTSFEESDTGKHYMFDGSQTWNEM